MPTSRQITLFAEGDHPVCKSTDFFGLRFSGLNPLMFEQRGDQTSVQGSAMLGIPS